MCAIVSLQLTGFGEGFVTAGTFEHFGLLRADFGSLLMDVLVLLKKTFTDEHSTQFIKAEDQNDIYNPIYRKLNICDMLSVDRK